MILAGDVGGTKTQLSLVEATSQRFKVHASSTFLSRDYPSFQAMVEAFQALHPHPRGVAAIGVAGPVIDNRVDVTNLPWVLDGRDLLAIGYTRALLVNDMVAYGSGIEVLDEGEFKTLNPGVVRPGNRALIAAGTGLGQCFIVPREPLGWQVHPSEGGHCDFSPTSDEEIDLLRFLRQKYQRVSWERVVSGKFGFGNIAAFLAATARYPEDQGLAARLVDDLAGPVLHEAAARGSRLASDTMKLFVRLYGSEAGNLALKALALGGLYVGGGIAPKILPWLEAGDFMAAFVAKGRFSPLVAQIPVRVILSGHCTIKGAALIASRRGLQS